MVWFDKIPVKDDLFYARSSLLISPNSNKGTEWRNTRGGNISKHNWEGSVWQIGDKLIQSQHSLSDVWFRHCCPLCQRLRWFQEEYLWQSSKSLVTFTEGVWFGIWLQQFLFCHFKRPSYLMPIYISCKFTWSESSLFVDWILDVKYIKKITSQSPPVVEQVLGFSLSCRVTWIQWVPLSAECDF